MEARLLFVHRSDQSPPNPCALSPEEWTVWKAGVIRRARAEQAAAIRNAFGGWTAILIRAVRRKLRGWRRQRCERRAAAELHALGDLELKDIAVSRSEIDARVRERPGSQFTDSRQPIAKQHDKGDVVYDRDVVSFQAEPGCPGRLCPDGQANERTGADNSRLHFP
ncbi:DUF1127 domain-containing protein [Bradyrhizobium prioriisuperbiae]|uniref:DUF1127 domain-containing protein n=1 Tax=Bradyrhizobium prioriisuperbiae TaxID=2854389 RepID=UPI0038996125